MKERRGRGSETCPLSEERRSVASKVPGDAETEPSYERTVCDDGWRGSECFSTKEDDTKSFDAPQSMRKVAA